MSIENCKRVPLSASSDEYQTVIQRFNATMKIHQYQIIKIERIQNQRWYKQVGIIVNNR
jgi:hypothetical protein